MKWFKKYWYVGLLLLGTIGLGVTTLIISVRLQQAKPVTPEEPHAQEVPTETPIAGGQCSLAFALTIPSSTPIGAPTATDTPIPSNTPLPTSTTIPTNTPVITNTPVPTAPPGSTSTPIPTNTPVPTNPPVATNTSVPTNTSIPGTNTPTTVPVTIGDYIWNDTNHNGIQDNGESGLPGVTVNLYNTQGQLVGSTSTNSSGYYNFTVPPGSYYVSVIPPSGYVFSPQYQGGNTTTDSNANTSGITNTITLSAGQSDFTIDSGLYAPGPTPTPAPGACSATCTTNGDCSNGLICDQATHLCRNVECTEQPNCACYFIPVPKVPTTGSGTTLIGLGVIGGGILLLLLGLAF